MRFYLEFLREYKWFTLFMVAMFALLITLVIVASNESEGCVSQGGKMVQTGSTTTYIMSNNVLIPITSPTYACTK